MSLFYDQSSGRYFKCDYIKLRQILFNLEKRADNGEFIKWNDYYDLIEIPNVAVGRSTIGRPEHSYKFRFKFTPCYADDHKCIVVYVDG